MVLFQPLEIHHAKRMCMLWTNKGKYDEVSMFCLPADKKRRQKWLEALHLTENDVNEQIHVSSWHFLHGNPSSPPSIDIGKRFALPKKIDLE